jgi:hypothetical protein
MQLRTSVCMRVRDVHILYTPSMHTVVGYVLMSRRMRMYASMNVSAWQTPAHMHTRSACACEQACAKY